MSTLKDAANNGTFLALAAVGVLAGVAAVRNTGFQLPTLPGMGGGFNEEADDWWAEEQGMDEDGQWETFGQEFNDFGSGNQGSGSTYNQFIGARIPQLTGQGHSSKDAMKVAAQEWRTQKGQ